MNFEISNNIIVLYELPIEDPSYVHFWIWAKVSISLVLQGKVEF